MQAAQRNASSGDGRNCAGARKSEGAKCHDGSASDTPGISLAPVPWAISTGSSSRSSCCS
jgi:hypothetical protein